MKTHNKMTLATAALVLLVGIAFICAASDPITTRRGREGAGWMLVVADNDIDTGADLLKELDSTAFTQIVAANNIYAVSGSTSDTTQTVWVSGIEYLTGKKKTESFALAGQTYSAISTATFVYIDQTWVDIECAGTVSIKIADNTGTLINSIEAGSLKGDLGHRFNGEKVSYVQKWWATSTTTDSKSLELRWYPDYKDCTDATDGFTLLDRIYMFGVNLYSSDIHSFGGNDSGVRLPAGGYLAIYGTGGAVDQEATVTVIGFDRRN